MNPNMELDLAVSLMHGRQEAKIITKNLVPGESARGEICQGTGLPHLFCWIEVWKSVWRKARSLGSFGEAVLCVSAGFLGISQHNWCFLISKDSDCVFVRMWSIPTLQWFGSFEMFLSVVKCQEWKSLRPGNTTQERGQDQHLPGHCPKQRVGVSGRARKIASEFRSCKSDFAFDSGNPGMASSRAQEPVAEACQRFTVRQVERLRCFIERHFPRILGSQFGTLRRVVLRFCSESTGGVFATVLGEFEAEFRRLCFGSQMYLSKHWRHDWCSWSWSTYILTSLVARNLTDAGSGDSGDSGIHSIHSKENANRFYSVIWALCIALWHVLAEMSTVCHSYIDWYIIDIGHSLTHFETPQRHCISVGYTVTCCGPLAHLRSTLGWSLQGFACWATALHKSNLVELELHFAGCVRLHSPGISQLQENLPSSLRSFKGSFKGTAINRNFQNLCDFQEFKVKSSPFTNELWWW